MSDLKAKLHRFARAAQRYLQVARLTSALQLMLALAPMLGALLYASGGAPGAAATFGFFIATLCLWGFAWSFNDLMNARRKDEAHSLILRGVLSERQAVLLLVILTGLLLLVALLMGWRFASLALVALLVASTYPWLRMHTYLIEAWFGLGIAWTVPLAYGVVGRWPDKVGALLGVITLLWAMGWLVLRQWPRHVEVMERGIRTLGLMFGAATSHLVIALQVSVLLGAWMAGMQAKFAPPYSAAVLASAIVMAWQALLLYRQGVSAVRRALQLHLISGAVLWLGVMLHFAIA